MLQNKVQSFGIFHLITGGMLLFFLAMGLVNRPGRGQDAALYGMEARRVVSTL
jgi:hypothetical protein